MRPKPGTRKKKSTAQKRRRSARRLKKRTAKAGAQPIKKLVNQMSAKLDVLFEMQVKAERIQRILPVSQKRLKDLKGINATGKIVDRLVESIATMQRENAMLEEISTVYSKELGLLRKKIEEAGGKKMTSSPSRIIAELRGLLRKEKADPEYLFKSEAEKSLPKKAKSEIAENRKKALEIYKEMIEWMSELFAMKKRGLSEKQKKHAISLEQNTMLFSIVLADHLKAIEKSSKDGKNVLKRKINQINKKIDYEFSRDSLKRKEREIVSLRKELYRLKGKGIKVVKSSYVDKIMRLEAELAEYEKLLEIRKNILKDIKRL